MRFWKAGTVAAAVIGPLAALQVSGAEAHGQVVIDRPGSREVIVEPMETARQVLRVLGGSRLGISIADVTAEDVKTKKLPGEAGAVVGDVEDESAASKAGIRRGDVIVEFDGEKVRSESHLRRLVQETPSGRKVGVVVWRDGQRVTLSVQPEGGGDDSFSRFSFTPRLEATPRPPRAPRAPAPPRIFRENDGDFRVQPFELFRDGFAYSFGGGRLGVTTQTLTSQLAKHFGAAQGVLVTEVREDSAAAKAGIRAGDVITKVGSAAIDDTGDLQRTVSETSGEVTIEVIRDRKAQTVKATIEAASPMRSYRRVI